MIVKPAELAFLENELDSSEKISKVISKLKEIIEPVGEEIFKVF